MRAMRPADIPGGLRLCRASGWNQVARDWEQFLALGPDGAQVIELDGRVVGTVATMRYGGAFAWIGMVLVDPDVRGRGLGTSLLDAGVAMLDDVPLVRLDATPAGHAIYIKREFREEYRLQRMRSVVPDGIEPPPVSRVRPMTTGDLDDVIAFDEEVFGARRAAMLRWMWEGAPEYAWAAFADGRLAGYTFGRHGYAFEHLGPIVAGDGDTALLLARAAMARHPGREFVVDAGEHSAEWLRGLQGLGFQPLRPLIRMARGRTEVTGDPARQFAILGPEFG